MEESISARRFPSRYSNALATQIEEKWRDRWRLRSTYLSPNPSGDLAQPNEHLIHRRPYYVLDMFPYPSGTGLHVGHPLGYIGTDVFARFKRMTGFNVLHTMGYDAFGLPAERYAVETGQHPEKTTRDNIAAMRQQLISIGLGHDPRRSIVTCDVDYYRWTQWIFLQLFNSWYDPDRSSARPVRELIEDLDSSRRQLPSHAKAGREWAHLSQKEKRIAINSLRLAYLDDVMVNWCPALGTVLANEEVSAEGRSEQGNFPVYRRPLRQWMLRITAYADRLYDDLDGLDWSDSLKALQRNWIGRSNGLEISFPLSGAPDLELIAFTTRPDTIAGATFLALAPEHEILKTSLPSEYPPDTPPHWRGASNGWPGAPHGGAASPSEAVKLYLEYASSRTERQRKAEVAEVTGVFTGMNAAHPLTGRDVPVFVADYVLTDYGTAALMGVPAHDARDFSFARKFRLPVVGAIPPPREWFAAQELPQDAPAEMWTEPFTGKPDEPRGASADGDPSLPGAAAVAELERLGRGTRRRAYKIRDWLFSRQRYWGEPIPVIYEADDDDDVPIALPESELPVTLPMIENFEPAQQDQNESSDPVPPLSRAQDWVQVRLDLGDGEKLYRREANTMPQWAGSCWYYLRYLDPRNNEQFVDSSVEKYWMDKSKSPGGVDLYVGGVEHAVLHLLYVRFWHKVLFDLGHVSTPEPFQRLFNQGYVQADAFTDERGFYVPAEDVVAENDNWSYRGEPVSRSFGKMGKSLKNGIPPDRVIEQYSADALRLYEMFLAPLDQDRPWDPRGISGIWRFLQRVWRLMVDEDTGELRVHDAPPPQAMRRSLHHTIAEVRGDLESLRLNTAISTMMEFVNELRSGARDDQEARLPREVAEGLVLALAPFAPHLCEELWERLGHSQSVVYEDFPVADEDLLAMAEAKVVVQINGKMRDVIEVPAGLHETEIRKRALARSRVANALAGLDIARVVVIPDRVINFVVGESH